MLLGIGAALAQMLSTTAFAIEESDVEAAINASSAEAVSGNVFIWFLCIPEDLAKNRQLHVQPGRECRAHRR